MTSGPAPPQPPQNSPVPCTDTLTLITQGQTWCDQSGVRTGLSGTGTVVTCLIAGLSLNRWTTEALPCRATGAMAGL